VLTVLCARASRLERYEERNQSMPILTDIVPASHVLACDCARQCASTLIRSRLARAAMLAAQSTVSYSTVTEQRLLIIRSRTTG